MTKSQHDFFEGDLVDEFAELTAAELCRACRVSADQLIELVDYGIVEPKGKQITQWRFSGVSIGRLRSAIRLQRDLGVNLPGVALALDLLEELNKLRQQVSRYQKLYNDLSE